MPIPFKPLRRKAWDAFCTMRLRVPALCSLEYRIVSFHRRESANISAHFANGLRNRDAGTNLYD
jgi:hypothetical protein